MSKCPNCGRHSFSEKGIGGMIVWGLIVATIISMFIGAQYFILISLLTPKLIPLFLFMQLTILTIMWKFYAGLINMITEDYLREEN